MWLDYADQIILSVMSLRKYKDNIYLFNSSSVFS